MTKITQKNFKVAVKGSGGVQSSVAKALNVTRSAITYFLARYPKMKNLLIEEEEKMIDIAENKVYLASSNGEKWAIERILKSKGAKRGWAETTNQSINTSFGDKLEVEITEIIKKEDK